MSVSCYRKKFIVQINKVPPIFSSLLESRVTTCNFRNVSRAGSFSFLGSAIWRLTDEINDFKIVVENGSLQIVVIGSVKNILPIPVLFN